MSPEMQQKMDAIRERLRAAQPVRPQTWQEMHDSLAWPTDDGLGWDDARVGNIESKGTP